MRLGWNVCLLALVSVVFATLGLYPGLAARYGLPATKWVQSKELKLGLDLRGGARLTLDVDAEPALDAAAREEVVDLTQRAVARRIDELGIMEPTVVRQGRTNRLIIELPGVTDLDRAWEVLGTTGVLEFRLVEDGPGSPPVVTGRDIRSARPSADEYGRPAVAFTLTEGAGRRFGEVTAANLGRNLAVVLDGKVESVAVIESRITTDGQIRGSFTPDAAADLAAVLRAGALPAKVTPAGQTTVGPSLGADSIRSGIAASVAGLLLVAGFMVAFYGAWGVNAAATMVVNLMILVGLMAYAEAVLTLPGIAGLILTIGMGVDSNVLVFERIKEELAAGQSRRAAVKAAFDRVFLTLLDTHVSALVAAACLFQVGSGAIRGFAVTLTLGLISNLFTSTFASRTLFELAHALRARSTRNPIPPRPRPQ